jgi:hypothetical protein
MLIKEKQLNLSKKQAWLQFSLQNDSFPMLLEQQLSYISSDWG